VIVELAGCVAEPSKGNAAGLLKQAQNARGRPDVTAAWLKKGISHAVGRAGIDDKDLKQLLKDPSIVRISMIRP